MAPFPVVGVVAPITNVGCVPPSDEIGTTGSDHGVMVDPPQHTMLLGYFLYGGLCSEEFCMLESDSHILGVDHGRRVRRKVQVM